jgi:multiple antibiotic resistance protein
MLTLGLDIDSRGSSRRSPVPASPTSATGSLYRAECVGRTDPGLKVQEVPDQMLQTRRFRCEKSERPRVPRRASLPAALTLGIAGLIAAGTAAAEEVAASQAKIGFPVGQLVAVMFLMLGPIKIVHPFLEVTKGADAALVNRIALRSTLVASLALLLAALIGERALSSFGIPLPVLALAGGIILFLVALRSSLEQFALPKRRAEETAGPPSKPTLKVALTPIAFPTIVTPYGIAALIVILAFSPDVHSRLIVGAVVLAIMVSNLITMITAARLLPVLFFLLPIVGAVLGVIQVAFGLQIIHNSLKMLRIL